ncbi:MAG: protein translocase SEC61 complex subunit gamma [Desulfurococcaceae archaeon]|nr:protein translocase SEC61 complex subunit gamma [Desulfurococcaceae archaeon]
MNLRELVDAWRRILIIVTKPTKDEYLAILKITLLGLIIIGIVSFIIRVVFYTFLFPYPG